MRPAFALLCVFALAAGVARSQVTERPQLQRGPKITITNVGTGAHTDSTSAANVSTDLQSQIDFLFANATLMHVGFAYALTHDRHGINGAVEVGPPERPNDLGNGWKWVDLFPLAVAEPEFYRIRIRGNPLPPPVASSSGASLRFALGGRSPDTPIGVSDEVTYGNVLPGVEARAYATPSGVVYEFTTHGKDALHSLELEFDVGTDVSSDGSLRLSDATHAIDFPPPTFLGPLEHLGIHTPGKFVSRGAHRIGFESPDENQTLTIVVSLDRPIETRSAGAARYVLRGGGDDVVTDREGNIYVAGSGKVNADAASPEQMTETNGDLVVAKLRPNGTTEWVTFVGGHGTEEGPFRIALMGKGVLVAGTTSSADFPQPYAGSKPHGGRDAFLAIFSDYGRLEGTHLIGSSGDERVTSLATDGYSHIVIGGTTTSPDFGSQPGAPRKGVHGFIATFDKGTVNAMAFDGVVDGVAVDRDGATYVAQRTMARDVAGANDLTAGTSKTPLPKVVVTKLAPDRKMIWSAVVATTASAVQLAPGESGDVYIAGSTADGIPMPTSQTLQDRSKGGQDLFVEHLAADGASLLYSTYLGGSSDETLFRMAVDHDQNVYLTGVTTSADFPVTDTAAFRHTGANLFFAKLDRFGHSLLRSALLAACDTTSVADTAIGMSVDEKRSTWLAVRTHIPFLALAPPGTSGFAVAGAAVLKIAPCIGCREAPTIEKVTVSGTALLIKGSGFDQDAQLFLGTKPADGVKRTDASTMEASLPANPPLRFLLQIVNADNQSASYEMALDASFAPASAALPTQARAVPRSRSDDAPSRFGEWFRNARFIGFLAVVVVGIVVVFRRMMT